MKEYILRGATFINLDGTPMCYTSEYSANSLEELILEVKLNGGWAKTETEAFQVVNIELKRG